MSDIVCSIGGEPWDAYGVRHGDMTPAEARKFLAGQGCPSCDLGKRCALCRGTGQEPCPLGISTATAFRTWPLPVKEDFPFS